MRQTSMLMVTSGKWDQHYFEETNMLTFSRQSIVYSFFTVANIFAPTVVSLVGPTITMFLAVLTYLWIDCRKIQFLLDAVELCSGLHRAFFLLKILMSWQSVGIPVSFGHFFNSGIIKIIDLISFSKWPPIAFLLVFWLEIFTFISRWKPKSSIDNNVTRCSSFFLLFQQLVWWFFSRWSGDLRLKNVENVNSTAWSLRLNIQLVFVENWKPFWDFWRLRMFNFWLFHSCIQVNSRVYCCCENGFSGTMFHFL